MVPNSTHFTYMCLFSKWKYSYGIQYHVYMYSVRIAFYFLSSWTAKTFWFHYILCEVTINDQHLNFEIIF